jgi:replicative DNA helicase
VKADPSLVASELLRRGELNRVGSHAFLHQLVAGVPSPGNATWYAREVRERGVLRRAQTAAVWAQQIVTSMEGRDADDILAEVQKRFEGLQGVGRVAPPQAFGDLVADIVAAITDDAPSPIVQWYWPYDALRHLLPGARPGQLLYVAARPAVGKSTLLDDLARCFAVEQGLRVDLWTREMPKSEVIERLLSAEAGIPLKDIREGNVRDEHLDRLYRATDRLGTADIRIYDDGGTLADVTAAARRGKTQVVLYDYVGLIPMPPAKGDPGAWKRHHLEEFSKGLKQLAKREGLFAAAASQLNRGPEGRKDKLPELADLRDSGSLEQDADMVILLHRPDAYEPENERAGEVDLIVAKDRNGPTGTVTLAHQLHYARFRDMARRWQQREEPAS